MIRFHLIVFLLLFTGYTLLYAFIFNRLGVKKLLWMRSAKVAALAATCIMFNSFDAELQQTTANLISNTGLLAASIIVAVYLKRVMILPLWKIFLISLGVTFGGPILLWALAYAVFIAVK